MERLSVLRVRIKGLLKIVSAKCRQLVVMCGILSDWLTRQYGGFVPESGGESGIRTHDEVAPIPVFETGAFVRSAISPGPVL